jgi:hypothetical protein
MDLPVNYNKINPSDRRLVREEYIRLQDGLCSHCGNSIDGDPTADILKLAVNRSKFPPNFFKWPIHLHHKHETGMTIGAVHAYCNAVLWQYHGE